jgi:hypothetical protein
MLCDMSDGRRDEAEHHHTPTGSLDNFEFTFNFSTTNLTGGSPIEPDVGGTFSYPVVVSVFFLFFFSFFSSLFSIFPYLVWVWYW